MYVYDPPEPDCSPGERQAILDALNHVTEALECLAKGPTWLKVALTPDFRKLCGELEAFLDAVE